MVYVLTFARLIVTVICVVSYNIILGLLFDILSCN